MSVDGALPTSSPDGSAPAAAHAQGSGFVWEWGPQAWIDMFMSKKMIVDKAGLLVTHTLIPILRLATDPARIDAEWAAIKQRREAVGWLDSPRERWRKRYGNFVREAEWALLELRKHLTREQYEEVVIGTCELTAREGSQGFLDMMNGMAHRNPATSRTMTDASGDTKPSRMQRLLFDVFNPAGFLTGPAEISEYAPAEGRMTMEIPDCAWHVCGPADRLPNPDALPEQGCLLICKGAFERLFDGSEGGPRMEFEPHLPETSCTVRMSWKVQVPVGAS